MLTWHGHCPTSGDLLTDPGRGQGKCATAFLKWFPAERASFLRGEGRERTKQGPAVQGLPQIEGSAWRLTGHQPLITVGHPGKLEVVVWDSCLRQQQHSFSAAAFCEGKMLTGNDIAV